MLSPICVCPLLLPLLLVLLRRGADIRHLQQFLGHADLETTKIYVRLFPGYLREDYDRAMPVLMGWSEHCQFLVPRSL